MFFRPRFMLATAGAAVICGLFVAIALAQAPPCLRSASAVVNGQTIALPPLGNDVPLSTAISAALGTPGVAPAPNTGSLTAVNVILCSGTTVSVTITPAVLAAVSAVVTLPPPTQPTSNTTTTSSASGPTSTSQSTSGPTTGTSSNSLTQPVVAQPVEPLPIVPTTPSSAGVTVPATPPQVNVYTVAASEILKLSSTVSIAGMLQPRLWRVNGQAKAGFNCNFYFPSDTPAGDYPLVESDLNGGNTITRNVTVTADPYHIVEVGPNEDLATLINTAPNLTRYILSPNTDYAITVQPYVSQRLEVVGSTGTTITCKPAIPATGDWNQLFAFWTTTAKSKIGVLNCGFSSVVSRFNSQGKTGTGAVYCSIGSAWTVNCDFNGVDIGMFADSTPKHQADGVLVQGCVARLTYGQMVWGGGIHGDVDTCSSGPSVFEQNIRFSILDLKTNQVPQLWRIFGCQFVATHQNATTLNPGKESGAFRDGKLFFISGNKFVGWAECGQGAVSAWDYWGQYIFDSNQFIDTPTAPNNATLNVRAGTNGAGVVSNNASSIPIISTARMQPVLAGNQP